MVQPEFSLSSQSFHALTKPHDFCLSRWRTAHSPAVHTQLQVCQSVPSSGIPGHLHPLWPGCLLPPLLPLPTLEGKASSLIYWGQALKETLPPGQASWPPEEIAALTDCARLYSSDPLREPTWAQSKAFYIKTHAGTWLILGSSPMCRLMEAPTCRWPVGTLPRCSQPVGYWVCPCRPRPHTHHLFCALGAGCKNGLSCPLASNWGFGQWKVLAPEQRKSIYFQLQPPPPPFSPILLAPGHFISSL